MTNQPPTFKEYRKTIGSNEDAGKYFGISKHVISELNTGNRLEHKHLSTFFKIKAKIPRHWDIKIWFPILNELIE